MSQRTSTAAAAAAWWLSLVAPSGTKLNHMPGGATGARSGHIPGHAGRPGHAGSRGHAGRRRGRLAPMADPVEERVRRMVAELRANPTAQKEDQLGLEIAT